MELIVILIVLAVIVLAGVALASYSGVDAAAARADVQMSVPGGAGFFSGWGGVLLEIAFWLLVLTVFIVVVVKVVWPWLRRQGKTQSRWKSGPNANWGRTGDEPKTMSTEKMLQLAVLSKLAGGDGGGPLILQQPEVPPEPQNQLPEGWW